MRIRLFRPSNSLVQRWAAGGFLVMSVATASAQVSYNYTDIGALWSGSSSAAALNEHGQVVGWGLGANNKYTALVWSAGSMTTLAATPGHDSFMAFGINNAGDVVGQGSGANLQAVLWRQGAAVALSPDQTTAFARDINDAGQITGGYQYLGPPGPSVYMPRAVVWDASGAMSVLPGVNLGQTSQGLAINANGAVAGLVSNIGGTDARPATWTPSLSTQTVLGYREAQANDINDRGQFVGTGGNGGNGSGSRDQAWLWDGSTAIALATPADQASRAHGLNEQAQIVGETWGGGFGTEFHVATLWRGDAAVNLNTLVDPSALSGGWVLSNATDINEQGWIVGVATQNGTGLTHAFLLTPVPEPSTLAMALCGLALVVTAARRRRSDGLQRAAQPAGLCAIGLLAVSLHLPAAAEVTYRYTVLPAQGFNLFYGERINDLG